MCFKGILCIIPATMKLYIAILALFISKNAAFCQFWSKGGEYLHVGNINCISKEQYLDSTKKAYHVAWQDRDIHNSRHIIDISLDLTAYPYGISARLYWDSTFTLYYTGYQDQNEGSVCLLA